MPVEPTEFEKGEKAGRANQVLEDLVRHSRDVNGSIAEMREALADLAGEIREQSEETRLRDERLEAARSALADETERRRSNLADADRRFTRRERLMALGLTISGLIVAALALLR